MGYIRRGRLSVFPGGGGSDLEISTPYIQAVQHFLSGLPRKISAVDLGCGDFRVGSMLQRSFSTYVACDVVEELITANKLQYANQNVEFRVLDLTTDEIPLGDMLILRQVLQHLSNNEISKFVTAIPEGVKYVLITEHLPAQNDFVKNLDKRTGASIRLALQSGVVITEEPFCLRVKSQRPLVSVQTVDGSIVTTLYEI